MLLTLLMLVVMIGFYLLLGVLIRFSEGVIAPPNKAASSLPPPAARRRP